MINNTRMILIYSMIAAALVLMIIENFADPWPVMVFSGLFLLSVTYHHATADSSRRHRLSRLTFGIDLILVFLISKFDQGSGSLFYYLVIVADASATCSFRFSSGITVLAFSAFAADKIWLHGDQTAGAWFPDMAFYLLAFLATHVILYLVYDEIRQKNRLSTAMYELKIKTKLLENAYKQLKAASAELEEMAALQERNEIAREIHDTVGHTLTTILLEMEAGERLIKQDPEQAAAKIRLAKGQVRRGLADIRQSVQTLKSSPDTHELISSIRDLIDETMRNGMVHIRYELDDLPELTARQGKTIYRALQEGLTNGIKHGQSTAFVFILKYENQQITFFLQDNGAGTANIVYGFGLSAMAERVKAVDGTMEVRSQPGDGLTIRISLPYFTKEVAKHEADQCPHR